MELHSRLDFFCFLECQRNVRGIRCVGAGLELKFTGAGFNTPELDNTAILCII